MTRGPGRNLHLTAGTTGVDGWSVVITPETAGWEHAGLRVVELEPAGRIAFSLDADEAIVVPLAGGASITCDGQRAELAGRSGVFSGPTDLAYLPPGASTTIESRHGGRFAVATARAEPGLPFRTSPASAVPIELRGAGGCSREIRSFAMPDSFEARRLLAVESVTPSGNWSSYPPHKHDEASDAESKLEEIYYFEIAAGPAGPGVGYQRVYGTPERSIDLLVEVRNGDVVLVPHGWHGPAMAAPGYDMYYLNVMAGPGPERAWRITDDPAHAWVRDTWRDQAVDPRLVPHG
jgi:5-deoxy-glucuronate isomerase